MKPQWCFKSREEIGSPSCRSSTWRRSVSGVIKANSHWVQESVYEINKVCSLGSGSDSRNFASLKASFIWKTYFCGIPFSPLMPNKCDRAVISPCKCALSCLFCTSGKVNRVLFCLQRGSRGTRFLEGRLCGYKNSICFNFSPRRQAVLFFLWLANNDIKVNIIILFSIENFLDIIRNEIDVACLGRKSICFLTENSQVLGLQWNALICLVFQDFVLHADYTSALPRPLLFVRLPQPAAHGPASPSPVLGLLYPEDAQKMYIHEGKGGASLPALSRWAPVLDWRCGPDRGAVYLTYS